MTPTSTIEPIHRGMPIALNHTQRRLERSSIPGNLWLRVAGPTRPSRAPEMGDLMETKHIRPNPAMVVACLALFVALGSGAYAAVKLKPNSVKAKNIKTGAVTGPKIGSGAVSTGKIADGAVATAKLAQAAVTSPKLDDLSVNNAKIGLDAVAAGSSPTTP